MLSTSDHIQQVADPTREWSFRMWSFGEGIALRALLAAFKATGNSSYYKFVCGLLKTHAAGEIAQSTHIGHRLIIGSTKTLWGNVFCKNRCDLKPVTCTHQPNPVSVWI